MKIFRVNTSQIIENLTIAKQLIYIRPICFSSVNFCEPRPFHDTILDKLSKRAYIQVLTKTNPKYYCWRSLPKLSFKQLPFFVETLLCERLNTAKLTGVNVVVRHYECWVIYENRLLAWTTNRTAVKYFLPSWPIK